MIYFLKRFKGIAYFLAILILFQSCVIYKKNSSTAEEATSSDNLPVKITTKDGKVHKFKWIEERDGNIVGIKKMQKDHYQKKDVLEYAILNHEPHTVPLDSALKYHGTIRLLVRDDNNKYSHQEFIKIRQIDDRIIGYSISGKDSVILPIDQIEKIQLKNVKTSRNDTIALITLGTFGLCVIGFIVGFAIAYDDDNSWDGI